MLASELTRQWPVLWDLTVVGWFVTVNVAALVFIFKSGEGR